MASVNKVILVGFLGQDPEIRTFPSGDQVANVSLATTDKWKDKQTGERREATEWHRLQFGGKLAEIAAQYLRKGSQIYIEGSIRHRKYQDQQGVEKTITEIRVDHMQMLDRQQNNQQGGYDDGGGYDDRRRGGGYGGDQGGGRGNYNNQGGGRGGYGNQGNQNTQGNRGNGGGYPNNGTRGAPPQNNSRGAPPAQQNRAPAPASGPTGFDDMDDDIPF